MTFCVFKKHAGKGGACKSKSGLSWPSYCSTDTKWGPCEGAVVLDNHIKILSYGKCVKDWVPALLLLAHQLSEPKPLFYLGRSPKLNMLDALLRVVWLYLNTRAEVMLQLELWELLFSWVGNESSP